ncbi:MAG: dTDP-4-dehydrorhamnose 3,5-epimerase family protein [Bacteroidales bacterium]|nr:dTDP-4-dehydrorhamnose 3,5-epimerase family protein [Bacteroidales bacterium]
MQLIKGNIHIDQRGIVRFVNDFHFENVKRFYTITHPDTNITRAWQGHKLETKYFYVTKGSFLINWIKIDNWQQPSKDLETNTHTLSDSESEILIIPPGHVNGFKALEPDSTMIVFSDMSLEESKEDDYRFDLAYFKFKA